MKIYVSGRGDVFEKERIAKGYAECYVYTNNMFYCCEIETVDAHIKSVNAYAENKESYITTFTNTIVTNNCSDEVIIKAINKAVHDGVFQSFKSISLFDIDNMLAAYDFHNSDLLYTDNVISNHLLRYKSKLYKFTVTKYNKPTEQARIISNIYDSTETLKEIICLLDKEGYLEGYKPYFDITTTELHAI